MRFDQPPPEPLASALGFLLSWSGRRMAHTFATGLEPLGLKPPHFGVLSLIAAQPGAVDVGDTIALGVGEANSRRKGQVGA